MYCFFISVPQDLLLFFFFPPLVFGIILDECLCTVFIRLNTENASDSLEEQLKRTKLYKFQISGYPADRTQLWCGTE